MKHFLLLICTFFLGLNIVFAQYSLPQLVHTDNAQKMEALEAPNKFQNNIIKQVKKSAPNTIWSEDFSNGIPSTWSYGGYFTTSTGIQTQFPDLTQNPAIYGWEYRGPNTNPNITTGTRGAYGGNALIVSPSINNGFIIFDSDYLDNAGTQGAFGIGPAPTPHVGGLMTDIIDCSNYPSLQLQLNSYQRSFFGQAFVAFSKDGGMTWPDSVELHMLDVNQATAEDNVEKILVSDFIGGEANAMIQFIFEGATEGNTNGTGYYFWQIDDIVLSEIPPYDLILYDNDFRYDNNDNINSFYGIELRDYVGHMPLNQIDSISFGFFAMNWGAMDQNMSTGISIVEASNPNNTVYSNVEYIDLVSAGDSTGWINDQKWLPSSTGEYIAEYLIIGDSADATDYDNSLLKGFIVTDTVYNPFLDFSNTDATGTGFFTGGDDGFKMANLISLINTDELTSVRIGLNRSTTAQYNTVPGGMIQITVFDTTGFYSASIENPILYSDFYFITADDTANREAIIPIPSQYLGVPQDRNLAPGSYYVSAELYSSANATPIVIRDDISTLRYPWESLIYIPGEQWYTNGNAFNISANFGTWSTTNIEEENYSSNLMVFPNPTSGKVNLKFSINKEANTSIIIKDLSGKIITNIEKGNLLPGSYSEEINLSNIAKGIYFYELKTNEFSKNGKIVLTK